MLESLTDQRASNSPIAENRFTFIWKCDTNPRVSLLLLYINDKYNKIAVAVVATRVGR